MSLAEPNVERYRSFQENTKSLDDRRRHRCISRFCLDSVLHFGHFEFTEGESIRDVLSGNRDKLRGRRAHW